MATKARKPAAAKTRTAKASPATAGAGAAIAERSKDAKPAFGKAAPRKVVPAAKTPSPRKAAKGKQSAVRTVASVAAGAVVATARGAVSLAASVIGKGGSKAKAK
ncbi:MULTISPECIES: hypothetical protein [unclassified Mesorhizobium]|uniref:hypothetical protein n=1 Tax=unclassified Mesorhizobium TaxID=325217 RepID=UPI00112BD7C7|nr:MULTISPECIES: hypothetical protein [unclassified Mesorhizobium]TPM99537.1 hypothetical protein FJ977_09065 [Mesorhizobium sp. B2-1-3A]BCG84483.1 hypothetical protein MesoLj113c_05930 [Mesorhizobium sp. 113-3-9]